MPSLKTNLVKEIDRLPQPTNTGAMQPLFEAVSNSIHTASRQSNPYGPHPLSGWLTKDSRATGLNGHPA